MLCSWDVPPVSVLPDSMILMMEVMSLCRMLELHVPVLQMSDVFTVCFYELFFPHVYYLPDVLWSSQDKDRLSFTVDTLDSFCSRGPVLKSTIVHCILCFIEL